ncbi:MAG: hypothetical protein IJI57_12980 [Flexilinea sp.]|nr:hypothetical protein [Flexilinea sp.]
MKKSLLFLVLLAMFASVFGSTAYAADVLTGEYELISMSYGGSDMDPASMGMSAALILKEDGTAVLSMNGSDMELPKWTAGESTVTLVNTDGSPLECGYAAGVVTLEMGENYYWYFYHESVNPNVGKEASMLSKVFDEIKATEGAHLSYEYHSDYMDSTSIFDVHAQNDRYFSYQTVKVSGYGDLKANAFLDGTVYLLYPEKKTGSVVMTISLSLLSNNVLMLDDCYKAMQSRALRKDFTVEEREVDGEKFTVEVFPASGSTDGAAFYFDAEGKLIHILLDAPSLMPSLGETFYTIHSFDKAVDASLFDISGYTIE